MMWEDIVKKALADTLKETKEYEELCKTTNRKQRRTIIKQRKKEK